MNADVLLEIRIENIPARFITSAEEQLKKYMAEAAAEANLKYEKIEACGTYKRLVLFMRGVPDKTEEKTQVFLGPSAKLLKDASGKYTKQAEGFARGKGTVPEKLTITNDPKKGEVLSFIKKIPGIKAEKALAEIFPKIISRLQFPKTMVWEASRMRFARPIRGIIAMRGTKTISFSIAGIKAGRTTVGLNSLGSPKVVIDKAENYLETMEKVNVVASDEKRQMLLRTELEKAAKAMNLEADIDEGLLTENVYLTEYPVCVVSNYSQEFLKLPKELVRLVMKKQLKFFTTHNSKGKLESYFIGIRDGISKGQQNVEEGFRNVLEARFRDAIFFYERDLAMPLEEFRKKLKTVTFQDKLGSMEDRAARVEKISAWLAKNNSGADAKIIEAAAPHVFSDLTSSLVREFTELQGIMGGYYASHAGMPKKAADAIGQFYFPASAESPLPETQEACLVSIAGKTDTLAADFSTGQIPTGSEDPHGLRRQALGLMRIMLEKNIKVNLPELFKYAYSLLPEAASQRDISVPMEFLWQRAEGLFSAEGYAFDEIKAVKASFMLSGDIADCAARLKDLSKLRSNKEFSEIASLFKRAKNILKNVNGKLSGISDASLYQTEEEKNLASALDKAEKKCGPLAEQKKYAAALTELLAVKPALDTFFLKVMVMDKDEKIKMNRLNLMKRVTLLAEAIADLSSLQ